MVAYVLRTGHYEIAMLQERRCAFAHEPFPAIEDHAFVLLATQVVTDGSQEKLKMARFSLKTVRTCSTYTRSSFPSRTGQLDGGFSMGLGSDAHLVVQAIAAAEEVGHYPRLDFLSLLVKLNAVNRLSF